jgi:hypothetical protein
MALHDVHDVQYGGDGKYVIKRGQGANVAAMLTHCSGMAPTAGGQYHWVRLRHP